jgi:hypothetical protein
MSEVEFFPARELSIKEFNSLRGRLCTVIESANLPNRQERALVNMIKNLSYQSQAVVAELIERLDDGERQFSYVGTKLSEYE